MAKIVLNNNEFTHIDLVKHGDYIQVRDSKMKKVGIVQMLTTTCHIVYPTWNGLIYRSLRDLIKEHPSFTFHVEGGENAEG